MKLKKNETNATAPMKKPFYKRWGTIAGGVAVLLIAAFLFLPSGAKNNKALESDFPKVDVAGMTVKDACAKVRAAGWPSVRVNGVYSNWALRTSDCNDEHIAKFANYTNKNPQFGLDSTAEINFEIANREDLTDSEKAKLADLEKSTADSSSKSASSSDTTSSSSTSEDWKKALSDYEAYIDEYVAFMKQYNANPNDPTLMSRYATMSEKMNDMGKSLDKVKGKLTGDDLVEYNKTMARITEKLSSI